MTNPKTPSHPSQEEANTVGEFGQVFKANEGLFLTGKIDLSLANDFTCFVFQHEEKDKIFDIYINSGGGDVDALCQINNSIDHLKSNGVKVRGIVIGEACSAALFILLNCNRRYSFKNCSFMYHSMMVSSDLSLVKDLKNYAGYYYSLNARMQEGVLNSVNRKDKKKLTRFFKECGECSNFFFGAEDAKVYGVVHEIIQEFL